MMYMLEVFQFTAISLKMTIPFIAADVSSQISCSLAFILYTDRVSLFGDLGKTALCLRGKGLTLSRSHFNIGAVFKVSSYRTVKYCTLAHSLTPGMDISLFCFYLGCKCTMNTFQLNLFTLYIHVCMNFKTFSLQEQ